MVHFLGYIIQITLPYDCNPNNPATSLIPYKLWEYTRHLLKFRTGHILAAGAVVVGRKNNSATCPTPFPEMGRKNRFRKLVGVVALSHYRNIPDRYLRMRLRLGKPPNQNTYPQVAVLAQ